MKVFTIGSVALLLFCTAVAGAEPKREIPASPGETLNVDLKGGGAISVTGSDRSSVAVAAAAGSDEQFSLERSGKDILVRSESGLLHRGNREGVEILVPRRFDVQLATTGGGITVTGVEGHIAGRTMGGALQLSNLRGEVNLVTMGGNITLTDSDVDGKVSTMGGKVVFRNVEGGVKGSSMGGNVVYDNVRPRTTAGKGKEVVISTQGGRIDVSSAPAGADVQTMGGDIEVASAREFVKARTMGGDIRIGEVDGSVHASTMGGSVEANVVGAGGKHDVDLESMSGPITLTLPAGFEGDFEISLSYTKGTRGDYSIKSDFPLSITQPTEWDYSRGVPRRVITGTGKTGAGTNKVKISTINGDVVIRKR